MLQVPPKFIQSTKSCWNRHALIHTVNMFGVVILSSIGSFSWDDLLNAGTSLLCILSSSNGVYCSIPADPLIQTLMGYKLIFIHLALGTFLMTGFNICCAIEFSAYGRHRNCGFGFAYTAFMRGTLNGFIAGIFGVLVGTAFVYLIFQNIIITRQVLAPDNPDIPNCLKKLYYSSL